MISRVSLDQLWVVPIVSLLWFAAVFDPIGGLGGLRYIALAGALGVVIFNVLVFLNTSVRISLRLVFTLYLVVVMPIYGLLIYAPNASSSPFLDTSYIAAGILLLTCFIYRTEADCALGVKSMVFVLRLLVLIITALFVCQISGLDTAWINVLTQADVAYVSFREYAGVKLPYIYFLASPMLIYLIAYELNSLAHKGTMLNVIKLALSMLAFSLSGTRAHMIIAISYPALYFCILRPRSFMTLVIVIVVSLICIWGLITSSLLAAFFDPAETSNSMKLGMVVNYTEIFSNIGVFLVGQGYNAYDWSVNLRNMIALQDGAAKTELTYIELIRVYGLCVSIPFLVLLYTVVKRSSKMDSRYRWLYPALVIYLLNSALNPYLFSTNGILPICLILSLVTLVRLDETVILGEVFSRISAKI